MKPKTLEYYNWSTDIEPEILKNLNQLLVAKNVEPLKDLHGGYFKNGKWVSSSKSSDYRNYWHVFSDGIGENLRGNDSYAVIQFSHDYDKNYELWCEDAEKNYGAWARDIIMAAQMMAKDYKLDRTVVYFSW